MSEARTGGRTGAGAPATRGVVFMHCCPPALAPHVEWALSGVLGRPARLGWSAQPAAQAQLRAELSWTGPIGTAARFCAELRAWPMLVFEITEDATALSDGERLAYLPGRGFHRSQVSVNGDVLIGEERVRGLLARARTADDLRHGLTDLLGSAWDTELEPYRHGGDGQSVSLIHQVV